MSQTDKELSGVRGSISSQTSVRDFNERMSVGIGSVTSRDQIIDPYSLVNPANYKKTRAGQAQYNSDLLQAQRYAEMQEAAYQEWYNSPEQQAIRDRVAGLNPDLIGLSDSEASNTEMNPNSPIAGQETNGQVASRVVSGITEVIGTLANVASLASSFAQIPNIFKTGKNLDLQNQNLNLQNKNLLRASVAGDISDLLGTAMQAHLDSGVEGEFDLESWFNDDSNFDSLQSVYGDNPYYADVLATQKRAVLAHHRNAVALQKDNASNAFDFMQVYSNPRYSSQQKQMLAQLMPVMKMINDAEESLLSFDKVANDLKRKYAEGIDVESASSNFNSQNSYDLAYRSALIPELMAEYDSNIKRVESSIVSMRGDIYSNLFKNYNADPVSNFDNALYVIGEVPSSWQTWGMSYLFNFKTAARQKILNILGIDKTGFDFSVSDSDFKSKVRELWDKYTISDEEADEMFGE